MLSNTLLLKVSPTNLPTHTELLTKNAKSMEEPSRLKNSLMSHQDHAQLWPTPSTNNQSLSELMPKPGNSTLEVSSLTAEPH